MTEFERQASTPPAPRPFTVIGRYGNQGKYKVFILGKTKIMSRDDVLHWAEKTRAVGGHVDLTWFR